MTTLTLAVLVGLVVFLSATVSYMAFRFGRLVEQATIERRLEQKLWFEAYMSRHAGDLAVFDKIEVSKVAYESQIAAHEARLVDREWERYEDNTRYEPVGGV